MKRFNKVYKYWIKFGDKLGQFTSKIALSIIFFLLFTPISLFLKLMGKDLLDKNIEKSKKSYWIEREIQPTSMKYQF
jgi:hypothetical protein